MNSIVNIGIDVGSRTAKIVFLKNNKIIYTNHVSTGINPKLTAAELLDQGFNKSGYNQQSTGKIFSTGYGRNIIDFTDKKVSEISCHAKGVHYLLPDARTVIDIGGQDSKIICLSKDGRVKEFVMNDKCAAGSGRFLEVVANILEVTVEDLGLLSKESRKELHMNSTCVVFAESEIIGLIASGQISADIISSVHNSIAKRTRNLLAQLHWQRPIAFTGGVAKNPGMVQAMSSLIGVELVTPEDSYITGALGAALFAEEAYEKS